MLAYQAGLPALRAAPGITCQSRHHARTQAATTTPSSSVLAKLGQDAEVLQLYRYPGLGESALHTLLRKVLGASSVLRGPCSSSCVWGPLSAQWKCLHCRTAVPSWLHAQRPRPVSCPHAHAPLQPRAGKEQGVGCDHGC